MGFLVNRICWVIPAGRADKAGVRIRLLPSREAEAGLLNVMVGLSIEGINCKCAGSDIFYTTSISNRLWKAIEDKIEDTFQ